MASPSAPWELLIEHGFIKSSYRHLYTFDEDAQKWVIKPDPKSKEQLIKPDPSHADEEKTEEVNLALTPNILTTGFPKPSKRYRLVYESFNASLEETYFWFLGHLRQDQAYPQVDKITDIFSASENSAFFGQSAQRLSIQEDRASNFLRGIAELVKQLFQIIRELRIIDERLEPYYDWEKEVDGQIVRSKSADSTLKGVFADFAENKGGQMQPGSLYHLSQTVGYAALPDLFFNTHVYRKEDVDKVIDNMSQFNPNVRAVLKRKLYQFVIWKDKTQAELESRKKFQIRYLRQHWATIKMYMSWTKPYLKHIKRLHMNERQLDSADIVSSFETSMTEVELLFKKPAIKGFHPVVLATYEFKTRPLLQYRQEYQQGPVHVGRIVVTMRAYAWSAKQIEMYKKLREKEEQDLLYLVDESVQAAMEELGDDLEKYINDAGKDVFDKDVHGQFGKKPVPAGKKQLKRAPSEPIWEPFAGIFLAMWDVFSAVVPVSAFKMAKKSGGGGGNPKDAKKAAMGTMYQAYKNYKKSHGLLAW